MSAPTRSNKRFRSSEGGDEKGSVVLHVDPLQYVEQARGGNYFPGRDIYLKHILDPDAANADLEAAIRTNNLGYISELECAMDTVRASLESSVAAIESIVMGYGQAKDSFDCMLVKMHRAKAVLSDTDKPLTRDPTPERAANILESINRQLGNVYAPEMVRARTGFHFLADIERIPVGVLDKVLEGLADSPYNLNPEFKQVMFNYFGKGVFHRETFPLNRVLSWHGYSRETKIYLIGFYVMVEDIDSIIQSHLELGEKFETVTGKDSSPWSGMSKSICFPVTSSRNLISFLSFVLLTTSFPVLLPGTPMRPALQESSRSQQPDPRLTFQASGPRRTGPGLQIYDSSRGGGFLLDEFTAAAAAVDDEDSDNSPAYSPNSPRHSPQYVPKDSSPRSMPNCDGGS